MRERKRERGDIERLDLEREKETEREISERQIIEEEREKETDRLRKKERER